MTRRVHLSCIHVALAMFVLVGCAHRPPEKAGEGVRTIEGRAGQVARIAMSPDGTLVAISREGEDAIEVWDVEGTRLLRTLNVSLPKERAMAFSPDGSVVAAAVRGDGDTRIRLWEARSGDELRSFEAGRVVWALAFGPRGRMLATAEEADSGVELAVQIFDVKKGAEVYAGQFLLYFDEVTFAADGVLWIAGTTIDEIGGAAIHRVDVGAKEEPRDVQQVQLSEERGKIVAVSPTAKKLITCDGALHVRELETERVLDTIPIRPVKCSSSLAAFSPNGERIAFAGADATIVVWEIDGNRKVTTLAGHEGDVVAIQFGADGETLVSAATDGTVKRWRVDAGDKTK